MDSEVNKKDVNKILNRIFKNHDNTPFNPLTC